MQVTNETKKAIELLRDYTSGTYHLYRISGYCSAKKRVAIMAALVGLETVPEAAADIKVLRAVFYKRLNITDDYGRHPETKELTFLERAAAIGGYCN